MVDYFEVELSSRNNPNVPLKLPTTPYTLLDAMSRLNLEEGEVPTWTPYRPDRSNCCYSYDSFAEFDELYTCLAREGSIFELNALIQKVSEMDDRQRTAFAGLLVMESGERSARIPLPRLIDLAYNTEACEVSDILDDRQLGRSRVESGSLPNMKDLPADIAGLLDFAQVGKNARMREGGAFVEHTKGHKGGYVVRHDLKQVYKDMDLTPKKPDYEILWELYPHWTNEQAKGKAVRLKLPADQDTVNAALAELHETGWSRVTWACLDCRVPSLIEIIDIEENPRTIISLAEKLSSISDSQLTVYKALLEDNACKGLKYALDLIDVLPQYTLSSQVHDPKEAAEAYLGQFLPESGLESIQPYLDWSQFGQALIRGHDSVLTGYGLIEQKDRPLISGDLKQEESQRGGMGFA